MFQGGMETELTKLQKWHSKVNFRPDRHENRLNPWTFYWIYLGRSILFGCCLNLCLSTLCSYQHKRLNSCTQRLAAAEVQALNKRLLSGPLPPPSGRHGPLQPGLQWGRGLSAGCGGEASQTRDERPADTRQTKWKLFIWPHEVGYICVFSDEASLWNVTVMKRPSQLSQLHTFRNTRNTKNEYHQKTHFHPNSFV